jgi:Holliday junction resolvase-like predicted endonuclease
MKIFTSKTQQLGQKGEDQAVGYLKKAGYTVLDRNVSNTFGVIDIVAKKRGVYYFFEVKAGNWSTAINPADNLTKAKLRKFFISIEYYCLNHKVSDYRAQGILVLFKPEGDCGIEIIELF